MIEKIIAQKAYEMQRMYNIVGYSILAENSFQNKSNHHYIRGITPKHVTTGGALFRVLAHAQHISGETSQRWRGFDRPRNRIPDLPYR